MVDRDISRCIALTRRRLFPPSFSLIRTQRSKQRQLEVGKKRRHTRACALEEEEEEEERGSSPLSAVLRQDKQDDTIFTKKHYKKVI